MVNTIEREAKKRAIIYLLLTVGVCLLVGIIAILSPDEAGLSIYSTLRTVFTAIAILAVLITRLLTNDKSP